MRHLKLRNTQQFDGGYTDLFILGIDTVVTNTAGTYSRTSDFTTAATTQAITLLALNPGDAMQSEPLILVKTPLAGGVISAATMSLGVTAALTQFIGNSDVFTNAASAGGVFMPAGTVGGYPVTAAKNLIANFITTGDNVSSVTAGEIWIYCQVARLVDMLTNRYE